MFAFPAPRVTDDLLKIRVRRPPTQLSACGRSISYQLGRITFATLRDHHRNRVPSNATRGFDHFANRKSGPVPKIEMCASPIQCQPLQRSEEHTSELQSLMRISYAVFCLKTKKTITNTIKIS